MAPRPHRLFLALGLLCCGAAVTVRRTRRLEEALASLRRSSCPSARLYDLLADRLLGGLYPVIARDAAAAIRDLAAPAVLEIGPGPGHVAVGLARLVPELRLVGLDLDPGMVARASRKAEAAGVSSRVGFLEGDVAALPFADASFDLVLSSFSVHHWPDPGAGFAEVRRVLRPSGRVIIYDLPDRWGRLETGAPPLAAAAARGGFRAAHSTGVRWPGPLTLVSRLELGHV